MTITIGKPFLWIDTANEFMFDLRRYSAWIQLFLLKNETKSVNLWKGNYPRIDPSEAELAPFKIEIGSDKNLISVLQKQLVEQVTARLVSADVRITKGRQYFDQERPFPTRLYHLEFENADCVPGLIIDPDLIAHEEWFED